MVMEFWHWIALGLGLMAVEMLVPSFFFLWLGAAALAVGLIMLAVPDLWWSHQWTLFAVLGVAAFFISRAMLKRRKDMPDAASSLNKRGEQLVGQIVVLETAIENGHGKAKVGDSVWSVEGADAPAGSKVKITAAEGTVLRVVRV